MNLSRLKYLVDKSGYSIRDFCQKVGIKTPTYYKIIKDNDARSSIIEKMCIVLHVSPLEFFEVPVYGEKHSTVVLAEPQVEYLKKTDDIHMGKIIEDRLDKIGMTPAEFGRRIGTTRQNAVSILKRKSIEFHNAVKYNEILNPSGSEHWDIFEYFLRKKPDTIEEKYIRLLEEVNQLQHRTERKKRKNM